MAIRPASWLPWLALLLAIAAPGSGWRAEAQATQWERDGLEGREVRALALAADSSGLVGLVGGSRDPTAVWLHDGQTWTQPTGSMPGFVTTLAPMPDGSMLLGVGRDLSDQPGVFLLSGGSTRPRRLYDAQAVGALAVAPGPAGPAIYAATAPWADRDASGELLRRDAASGAWTVIHQGTLMCGDVKTYFRRVIAAPSNPNTLYAVEWCFASAVHQTQLWRSDDRGQTWQVVSRSNQMLIGNIAVDPDDEDTIYLAGLWQIDPVVAGLERSTDGGLTWTTLELSAEPLANIRALLVDPRDTLRILVGTDGDGVLSSHDRGETWAPLAGLEGVKVRDLALDKTSGRLYAATSDGVWRMPLP